MNIYFSKDEFIMLNNIINDFSHAIAMQKISGGKLPNFYNKDTFLRLEDKIIENGKKDGLYINPSNNMMEEQINEVNNAIEILKQQGYTEETLNAVFEELFY